ncbi:hypothetical protein SAMN06265219_102221 [Gracilimonas mengyeensis]|uniref:Uncharacterized protein n=2 Tax=Gracilimonas mengyeensis TaxID=1302730 RepID=A0A521BE55_9BACT|nr:hypothetical protein SAMN06265219_102221 [Gracilimonas mengyeensis]
MKKICVFILALLSSLSFYSCNIISGNSNNGDNKLSDQISITLNQEVYYLDFDSGVFYSLVNNSDKPIYTNSSDETLIEKKIDDNWNEVEPSEYYYVNPVQPGDSIIASRIFSRINGLQGAGTYRIKVNACLENVSDECPSVDKVDILSNEFQIKPLDIPLTDISPKYENIDLEISITDTLVELSSSEGIGTNITNHSDFPIEMSSSIVEFQRYTVDRGWISGVNGISGRWFVFDGFPSSLRLDPGESIAEDRAPFLPVSWLSETPGTYRFNYLLCMGKDRFGACILPVTPEFSSSASFEVIP